MIGRPLLRVCAWRWGFWFRLFGWGFHIKPKRGHTKRFSELYGGAKVWYFGPLRVQLMEPWK